MSPEEKTLLQLLWLHHTPSMHSSNRQFFEHPHIGSNAYPKNAISAARQNLIVAQKNKDGGGHFLPAPTCRKNKKSKKKKSGYRDIKKPSQDLITQQYKVGKTKETQ